MYTIRLIDLVGLLETPASGCAWLQEISMVFKMKFLLKISKYIAKFHKLARIGPRDFNYIKMFITIALLLKKRGYIVKSQDFISLAS